MERVEVIISCKYAPDDRVGRVVLSRNCPYTMGMSCSWPQKTTEAAASKTFLMFILWRFQCCHLEGRDQLKCNASWHCVNQSKSCDAGRAHQINTLLKDTTGHASALRSTVAWILLDSKQRRWCIRLWNFRYTMFGSKLPWTGYAL